MINKWKLLSAKDSSPNKWFPIETRTYQLPNGKIVDDFTVSTIADVAMVVPITQDHKIILVNQFKPGVGEVVLEFPAGRLDEKHPDLLETAQLELEEEAGVKVEMNQLIHFSVLAGFTTKASEKVHMYLAQNCEFNSTQKFDTTEDIEVFTFSISEIEQKIKVGEIWTAQTIAGYYLAKMHFPDLFSNS